MGIDRGAMSSCIHLSDVARDEGATAVEYALIAVLVAAVIAAIVGTVGGQLLGLFTLASNGFP